MMYLHTMINRPSCDGAMAYAFSPDDTSIVPLQPGPVLPPAEPQVSMPNAGSW